MRDGARNQTGGHDVASITISHKKDGTPYARPYLGTSPATGRRVRPYREFPGMTDAEAEAAARAWVAELQAARKAYGMRLSELLDRYAAVLQARGYATNTLETYRRAARRHTGRLARARAADVTTEAIDTRIIELLQGGRGHDALSPQTVRLWRDMLHGAYRWALSIGIVDHNPVDGTIRPRGAQPEALALDRDQLADLARRLYRTADPSAGAGRRAMFDSMAALAALIALHTGMRLGEVCALRWSDVGDPLMGNSLHVRGTVVIQGGRPVRKPTTKGRRPRAVAMPQTLADLIAAYRERAAVADWSGMVARLSARGAGRGRPATARRDAPICTVDGDWLNPKSVSRWFTRRARAWGMPEGTTFHTMRHTHATILLQMGYDARLVQERLGHADVATTLRTYAHVMPARDAQAAQTFGGGVADGVPTVRQRHFAKNGEVDTFPQVDGSVSPYVAEGGAITASYGAE